MEEILVLEQIKTHLYSFYCQWMNEPQMDYWWESPGKESIITEMQLPLPEQLILESGNWNEIALNEENNIQPHYESSCVHELC